MQPSLGKSISTWHAGPPRHEGTRTHKITCSELNPPLVGPIPHGDGSTRKGSDRHLRPRRYTFLPKANNKMFDEKGFVSRILDKRKALGWPTHAPNGAFSGEPSPKSYRAIFFAKSVEIMAHSVTRTMDSEAIKLYIKDAPLKAMSKVELEALASQDLHKSQRTLASYRRPWIELQGLSLCCRNRPGLNHESRGCPLEGPASRMMAMTSFST